MSDGGGALPVFSLPKWWFRSLFADIFPFKRSKPMIIWILKAIVSQKIESLLAEVMKDDTTVILL